MVEFEAFAFDQPFQESVDVFLRAPIMTRDQFEQVSAAMKAQAFTAAKVSAADALPAV
jgi:hypothetical protein